jgi:diacylglycerol kinase family enzyme
MKLVIVHNPISGRGQAAGIAREYASALRADGHDVTVLAVEAGAALREALEDTTILVVVGGDGTLHGVLPHAIATGAPVYHVPTGTENLFAREFGMSRDLARVRRALAGGHVRRIDVGECGGRPFAIMASGGPDASVMHRMARRRTGPITYLSYVPHVAAELREPRLPALTIECDGQRLVQDGHGMVVVANLRAYALRVDPACDAKSDDGRLDVVFFPARRAVELLWWEARSRFGLHRAHPRSCTVPRPGCV